MSIGSETNLNASVKRQIIFSETERRAKMKRVYALVGFGFIVLYLLLNQGCVVRETYTPPPGQTFHHGQLRVTELEMSPDPAREGQKIRFSMLMVNNSSFSRRVNIAIRDGDELVNEVSNISIRPGANQIRFPYTGYRFRRQEPCFVVLVDIGGNYKSVDLARRFCVQRTLRGWTLSKN
jgi:hypothetical protein